MGVPRLPTGPLADNRSPGAASWYAVAMRWAWLFCAAAVGCGAGDPGAGLVPDASLRTPAPDAAVDAGLHATGLDATGLDAGLDAMGLDTGASDAGTPCPLGADCNPILIDAFPFVHRSDTSTAPSDTIDRYGCAPTTDESGPEVHYRLVLTSTALVHVSVDDLPGDTIDVDIHLLDDDASCIARDNVAIERILGPGGYAVIVDTFVNSGGDVLAGPYELTVDRIEFGRCAMDDVQLRMFWRDCDPAAPFRCYEANDSTGQPARFLSTPAIGPVVKEAHLVTVDETFANGWPTSFTDQIDRHYRLSAAATGYVMNRGEPWAPAGEGGSRFGQGSTGRPVPVLDEAWYVNMHWRDRPARGTRVIVMNPRDGRAVVASGGYETGPGANTAIGGASEEIHHALGTSHRDTLLMGFATDQTLDFGPIDCDP